MLKPNVGIKRPTIIDDEEEDLGASIKRRVRRVPKAEGDSDYDLNSESDKEEKKLEQNKQLENHKSQLDTYLSKLAY